MVWCTSESAAAIQTLLGQPAKRVSDVEGTSPITDASESSTKEASVGEDSAANSTSSGGHGRSASDKIVLGIGIMFGLPATLAAVYGVVWLHLPKKRRQTQGVP